MLPDTHTKSISDITIKFITECFHTSYLEVVNPSSNKLIVTDWMEAINNLKATYHVLFAMAKAV